MSNPFGPRRASFIDIAEELRKGPTPLTADAVRAFDAFDLIYRSLCALMYNYVPASGHPGGSISSGRFVAALLFDAMAYDLSDPDRGDADIISYAAGHKALGLYAMWALRNEVARLGAPELLPQQEKHQLRLEDLLGFRRNPVTETPLFLQLHAKALDGHPTPTTPFVRLATGASGVGLAASIGLALAAADRYGEAAPTVHIVEGEGGLTPGRVSEALAAAGTASLRNVVLHIDFNQASIDSDRVCRDGTAPGDYVQWTPAELCYLHDWNVIAVPDGRDLQQICAAQRSAAKQSNGQPTAIVYRTVKGWQYGIEGRASHGSGHKLCSTGFYEALDPLLKPRGARLPKCESGELRCQKGQDYRAVLEACFWEALQVVRGAIKADGAMVQAMAARIKGAAERLEGRGRKPRPDAPRIDAVYQAAIEGSQRTPEALGLKTGAVTTLRGELARALNHLNRESRGALIVASADLIGSTSANLISDGFPAGFFNARGNAGSRTVAAGGICEDALSAIVAGISAFGRHIGVGTSYGAFLAPLGHIASRLHAIGAQARHAAFGDDAHPAILVCAHAGLTTGEDGPTHADPQSLQLLQENFPLRTAITLTPWEPQEIWPLLCAALVHRPAIIAPFVTRPNLLVPDRAALKLAPAEAAKSGVYRLRSAASADAGTVILQESGVTMAFVHEVLPRLDREGIDLNAYSVASAELFDLLSPEEQERILPAAHAADAIGITGFTLPTMLRWVTGATGRSMTLHPYRKGHYLGSGQADAVLSEAGLDPESQYKAIMRYLQTRAGRSEAK